MSSETSSDDQVPDEPAQRRGYLGASAYLWKPWYAKLWWVGIPLYWAPAGGPTRVAWLADFYESGYAVVPNIMFLPVTALLILGFGYFRRRFKEGEPVDPYIDFGDANQRLPGLPHPSMDEFNPRSGPRWIGNRTHNRVHR